MLQVFRRQTYWIYQLLLPLLLVTGCLRSRTTEVAAVLPLEHSLPAVWQPLRAVQEINLDQDSIPEYLLFFTYDGANGPVGAVIYDNRLGDAIGVATDESNRPSASLMPYPILPNYRTDSGQGFIAEPGQKDAVDVYALNFGTANPTQSATPQANTPAVVARSDALAILGGTTYLTFVWWQPRGETYGITQLYAPGHFEAAPFQPFDWDAWRAAPTPITDIIAVHPVHDRNLLCYRRRHTLVAPNQEQIDAGQPFGPITYRETNLGLDFCSSRPATPFYPEGVVLAYLLGNNTVIAADLDEATRQSIQATAQPQAIVYVKDLASYKTIPDINDEAKTMQVCAEVLRPGADYLTDPQTVAADSQGNAMTFEPTVATGAPPHALQWLLFTLTYEPFRLDPAPPLPDRLFIVNVIELPVAARYLPLECKVWLGKNRE